ncbi:tellurite resistance TerB family protein [Allorhodopirellula heiligendammensis]|uniref:Inner membrane protein YebE n=1 Tax=Allorhodopirellula heiligendammensis TaxID=2714739 RepID=A0A5C6BZ78_9BACT|nr:DUF533 domain-containing protein [Allorhodopirellula heiligendammensis]TWU16224.1 Inner membrane protein YebE [Allorhodopirellula heiligendammensis]
MDITDILGSLLGGRAPRGGTPSDAPSDTAPRRSNPGRSNGPTSMSHTDIERQAKELEDLLNVSKNRHSGSTPPAEASPQRTPVPNSEQPGVDQEQGTLLVRAMINAAKADGQIDPSEQQNIMRRLHNPSRETLQFLQDEFDRPQDLRGFAMSVPVGMEQQVYTLSLMTINLDSGSEAKYLKELGDTLRLSQEVREQIHQRVGAPSVY